MMFPEAGSVQADTSDDRGHDPIPESTVGNQDRVPGSWKDLETLDWAVSHALANDLIVYDIDADRWVEPILKALVPRE
jgi:hypothetical protein